MSQTHADTLKETICTVGIGYIVSLVMQILICHIYKLPLTIGDNATITGIFTITSIVRVYVVRRMFNSR